MPDINLKNAKELAMGTASKIINCGIFVIRLIVFTTAFAIKLVRDKLDEK